MHSSNRRRKAVSIDSGILVVPITTTPVPLKEDQCLGNSALVKPTLFKSASPRSRTMLSIPSIKITRGGIARALSNSRLTVLYFYQRNDNKEFSSGYSLFRASLPVGKKSPRGNIQETACTLPDETLNNDRLPASRRAKEKNAILLQLPIHSGLLYRL